MFLRTTLKEKFNEKPEKLAKNWRKLTI